MKNIYTSLVAMAITLTLTLTSCTENNGDIGEWFGTWHIETVTVDGVPDANYAGYNYLQFQSTVVALRFADDVTHDEEAAYGTWSEGDGWLDITFPSGDVAYIDLLGMKLTTANHLTISDRTDGEMTLTLSESADGAVRQYHIRKLH